MWTAISQLTSTPEVCTCSRNAGFSTILQEVWVSFFVSSSKADVDSASFIFYSPLGIYQCSSHVLMLQRPSCAKSNVVQWQALPPSCSPSWISRFTGTCWTIHSSSFCVLIPRRKRPPESSSLGLRRSGTAAAAAYMEGGGINSLQEERQKKLHGMVLWPELQHAGSAWLLSFALASIRVILDGPEITSFPHLVKFKSSEPFAAFTVISISDREF